MSAVMTEEFKKAAEDMRMLNKWPTLAESSELYGFYKQALAGDINIARPGLLDFTGKAKWDAWNSKKGLSSEEAMTSYLSVAKEVKEKYAS